MTSNTVIDTRSLPEKAVRGIRAGLIVTGAIGILVGILILAQPGSALVAVGWLFGLYFIVAGILRLTTTILAKESGTAARIFTGILGALLIIGGIYTLANPVFGAAVLAMVIGITWVIEGIASLADRSNDRARWFAVVYGIISIVAGVLVFFIPVTTAAVLLVFVAIMMIVAGVVQIVQAFLFGRHGK
ncbi:HdeD family acid-resistance protein [Mycetocola spongiae]|uniref:HdeD family acid-resistance protein n=1 Tax=Mycetocola spongiae TaxID=2859226 RepID=UPI001CF5009C|nr:DUF308 domain-containing protein [Mycetocola spongiae]UCR89659.1 DUF308 domain-containing protein [Mycetocola spongiae]